MEKLQRWITSHDQVDEESKIINIMILEGRDRLAQPSDYDQYFASPSSSSEDADDSNGSCGPLYELSELQLQLPIKRGLSKYYRGKSQSFKNLGNVKNVKDFAKEMSSKGKGRSSVKSYTTTPKHIICKKSTSSLHFLTSISRR